MGRPVRITISLQAASLSVAKARRVKLSKVVSEALDEWLKQQRAKDRAKATFARYQRAVAGLNEEELLILTGFIPEHRRTSNGQTRR